jgi:hypothetical protein
MLIILSLSEKHAQVTVCGRRTKREARSLPQSTHLVMATYHRFARESEGDHVLLNQPFDDNRLQDVV